MGYEIKPLGHMCNLQCRYCYQAGLRAAENNVPNCVDISRLRKAIRASGSGVTLFGGEPLLLPLDTLETLLADGYACHRGSEIQTNGTLITDAHVDLFRKFRVSVGISIDGPGALNTARWAGSAEQTLERTEQTLAAIASLAENHIPVGLITTLTVHNANIERLPILLEWFRELDSLGIDSVRLHLLEAESETQRRELALSDEQAIYALDSLMKLEKGFHRLRFDLFQEIRQLLRGRSSDASCIWRSCDPWHTDSVDGVENDGTITNCGRTCKDGINFLKNDSPVYARSIALYHTDFEAGGCRGCRFFLCCRGNCPGTAIAHDWRNRSEHCAIYRDLFEKIETELLLEGITPLSHSDRRKDIEDHYLLSWVFWRNPSLEAVLDGLKNERADTVKITVNHRVEGSDPAFQGFKMQELRRVQWVSKEAKERWEPAIEKINGWVANAEAPSIPDCCARRSWKGAPPVGNSMRACLLPGFIGTALLRYIPCDPSCERSLLRLEAVLALMANDDPVLAGAAREILTWHLEWSSLHGITLIKTPVMTIMCDFPALSNKITYRFPGGLPPSGGFIGDVFPYTKDGIIPPEKLEDHGIAHLSPQGYASEALA